MMEYTYYTDLNSMLQAIVAGVLMGVYYDAFRLVRRMVRFDRISVALQDLLFWMTSAVYLFFVCIRLNNGYIRIYFILFALTGWGIYYATVGRFVFVVFDFIIRLIHRWTARMKKGLLSVARQIYIKIRNNTDENC